ncbi:hypothetical protein [Haloferula sp. BvORR071]|uniref:hypothetical protein n=1 Tax=Haloferula sp. BvORR071 TaxID=1396141 RepID=UPI00054FD4A2|nr:hypothetical protein [Haloferula sp. BvORR071]
MRIPLQPEGYYRLSQLKQNQVFAAANRGGRLVIVTVLAFVILLAASNGFSLWIYHEVGGSDIATAALMSTLGWTLFLAPLLVRFLSLPLLAHWIGKELQRRAQLEDRFQHELD